MMVLRFLEGSTGRLARVAAGLALVGLGVALGGWWLVLAAVGLLPLVTGSSGVCLISRLGDSSGRGTRPA